MQAHLKVQFLALLIAGHISYTHLPRAAISSLEIRHPLLPEALDPILQILLIESRPEPQSSYHGPKGHWKALAFAAEPSLDGADCVLLLLAAGGDLAAQSRE